MCEGIAAELSGISLGDERLNKRSVVVIEALAGDPQASINGACDGWSDTLAAYRFLDNDAVTPEQILQPHREATLRRMREHPVVLIPQDTTELDYTRHPPRDARCLNIAERRGLFQHVQLAVTPDRLCLGVVGVESFDRAADSLGRAEERRTLPIEQKESFRWLKGYRLACALAAACPGTQVVSIADREADIYDIFVEAQRQPGVRAEYLIRAQEDRSTLERDPDAGPAAYHKVRDEVRQSKLLRTRTIELPQTPTRAARTAVLEIRALTVAVKPPHARQARLPSITHNVVLAEEIGGPEDGTDVSWLLLTTLPIETTGDVLRILDDYVARWVVEIYFRTLKSGCLVEKIQLETNHRLKNCLAFYHIIAWRVLHLTYLNRASPKLPCTAVFQDAEWKSVWRVVRRTPLPKTPPVLSEFMKLLTQLGGYNNRATEAPPGPQPVWIGLRRMLDFARAWLTFGPDAKGYV
jgi:Transposase DNA-binding/Transposase Tn5 dimerisation domain